MPTVPVMAYEIDQRSETPLYRQLAALLRAEIEAGRIGPDEALPSIRRLEQETGLDPKTIRHAIGELVRDGLVVALPGRGTFVRPAAERP
jgi:DNA-binding GntR family transcriptional regulator